MPCHSFLCRPRGIPCLALHSDSVRSTPIREGSGPLRCRPIRSSPGLACPVGIQCSAVLCLHIPCHPLREGSYPLLCSLFHSYPLLCPREPVLCAAIQSLPLRSGPRGILCPAIHCAPTHSVPFHEGSFAFQSYALRSPPFLCYARGVRSTALPCIAVP